MQRCSNLYLQRCCNIPATAIFNVEATYVNNVVETLQQRYWQMGYGVKCKDNGLQDPRSTPIEKFQPNE